MTPVDWDAYLADFHRQRPGITEDVLARAHAGSQTPYSWVADAIEQPRSVVIDLACGSGPLHALVPRARWIGLDTSAAELALARARGAATVVRASAESLPIRSSAAGVVMCSMALMIVHPLGAVLRELARVLRPAGRFVALVPSDRPLTGRDRARYLRMLLALRQRHPTFPNEPLRRDAAEVLSEVGLEVVADERRRFAYALPDERATRTLLRSLYLPGVPPARIAAAERVARRWVGHELGLPLRRIVARSRAATG
ncbi:MAG: class I SAM-dependent methyltransferase [Acidimicrobiales bacterium]